MRALFETPSHRVMNPDLQRLQPYPFEKLAKLFADIVPPKGLDAIRLSIGEPKHPTPELILDAIREHLDGIAVYPLTKGEQGLRQAIADWLTRRFRLPQSELSADTQVLPVNGTREALFAFAQTVVDRTASHASVLMPNPFYQIYEGAAFLAGAHPVYLNCTAENGFNPDFDALSDAQWDACQLLFLCSPGNPTGAVVPEETLHKLIQLAHKHDFVIASDECYSEIYPDEARPPVGLLQASASLGNKGHQRCVVFHSLSKRSNAPGLRSGFVAGDAELLKRFHQYRTYHGCAMSPTFQAASIVAWNDEQHVIENRTQYRRKFAAVKSILDPVMPMSMPDAGFYFWAHTPFSDTQFAQRALAEQNVVVLPGSYLSREIDGINPGENYVRMALVAPLEECTEAATRLRTMIES